MTENTDVARLDDEQETMECTRCGRELPIESFRFVKYKGQTPKYRFKICKDCQNIETRRRYLEEHDPDSESLAKINMLYEKHIAEGRSVPTERKQTPDELVDMLLAGD